MNITHFGNNFSLKFFVC